MSTLTPGYRAGIILAGLSGVLSSVGSFGAELISRPFEGMRYSPRLRSDKTSRARAVTINSQYKGTRKLHRTTRAMTSQGRILQHHFDSHRLTRSKRKKFYAGKQL